MIYYTMTLDDWDSLTWSEFDNCRWKGGIKPEYSKTNLTLGLGI
jgi:hypothetical protein